MGRQLLICVLVYCTCAGVSAVSHPPSIYKQPDLDVYFKTDEPVQLPCAAEAVPNATYTWKRNGISFNPSGNDDRIVQLPDEGTLIINRPEDRDEGVYQCLATNTYGVSASINFNLREAKLSDFQPTAAWTHKPSLGSSLTLMCVPPVSVPPPDVIWVIRGSDGTFESLILDNRVTMDHDYRLRITNVKSVDQQDGKSYACMVMNRMVRKSILGPDNFIQPQGVTEERRPATYMWATPSDSFGLLNDTFRIKCIFAGSPTPDVHWSRPDGKSLPDHSRLESFGQELVFSSLQFSDAGDYECQANNTISLQPVQRTISIRVESRPYWTEEPQNIIIGVGETAHFKCLAQGVPVPTVKWYINSVPLDEVTDPRIDSRFKLVNQTDIEFSHVTRNDAMVVQCNVTNKHGYIWGDVYLNVLAEAPTITVPPANVVVAESQSVILTCQAAGTPVPQVTWYKDNFQIAGGRFQTLINGDLHIESVRLSDSGIFRCVVINMYGSQEASGTLTVRKRTFITEAPVDVLVVAGNSTTFKCSAITDPKEAGNLVIYWMKNNHNITVFDQRMTTNSQDGSLTIAGTIARDSGNYTCIATNGIDNATASASLTVKDRPDPPFNIKLERCQLSSALISWTPGISNNAPVQHYIVQYNTSFTPTQWVDAAMVNPQRTNADINLSPYANFTFRVIAYNEIGESKPSYPTLSVCRTPPAIPFNHPKNVGTIGDTKNQLHVKWTPMPQIQHNGPGFQYILAVKRRGDDVRSTIMTPIDDWRRDTFLINTMDVYQAYEITLKARNALGDANMDAKTIIGFSGEDVPTIAPRDLQVAHIEATRATLSWNFDMTEVGREGTVIHGEFRGFKVQVWTRNLRDSKIREWNITQDMVEKDRVGNKIYATIINLQPNTELEAQVSVMNNFYVGPPTDIVKFQTKESDFPFTSAAPSPTPAVKHVTNICLCLVLTSGLHLTI